MPAGGAAEQAKSGGHGGERCLIFPSTFRIEVRKDMLSQTEAETLEKYNFKDRVIKV